MCKFKAAVEDKLCAVVYTGGETVHFHDILKTDTVVNRLSTGLAGKTKNQETWIKATESKY